MKLSLSKNISKLRKEHSMTQEQLAEALGVTFASVSKWERGVATPELNLIAEMADLFGVSLDALVGFEVLNGGVDVLEKGYTIYNCRKNMMKLSSKRRRHCCGIPMILALYIVRENSIPLQL